MVIYIEINLLVLMFLTLLLEIYCYHKGYDESGKFWAITNLFIQVIFWSIKIIL
jgi:hypothetical protein